MMDRPLCGTCPYWLNGSSEVIPVGQRIGECRRNPLTTIVLTPLAGGRPSPVVQSEWPQTTEGTDDDIWEMEQEGIRYEEYSRFWGWCGEHPDFPAYIASLKEAKP